MLDCCILGAVRMNAEALEAEADKAKATAAEVSEEAASAAAKAKKLEDEAAEKKAELKAANEAYAEATKSAEAAKAEYSKTQKLISDSKCENNPGCADVGLTGFSCPTLNGMTLNGTMLGCCPSSAAPQLAARLAALSEVHPPAVSLAEESPKTCSAYDECSALQGDCCPNKDGVMLSCCILGAVRMKAESLEKAAAKIEAEYEKVHAASEAAQAEYAKTSKLITESKCENNPACVTAGLTGYCCPTLNGMTLNGTMLGCCGGGAGALADLPDDGLTMPFAAAFVASAAAGAALVLGASRCRGEAPADGYIAAA